MSLIGLYMRIYWYIVREYFRYLAINLLLALSLFIIFDFIHKATTYFETYEPTFEHIALYYIYRTPYEVFQLLPIASLLAGVIAMVLLNRSGEIAAMRASGMSTLQLSLPLIVAGTSLSFFLWVLGNYVVPKTAIKLRYVEHVLKEGKEE